MVVAIIIILATIIIISVREATDRGKNTKVVTSIVQIRKLAENMYLQESDGYTSLCTAGNELNDAYSTELQVLHGDILNYAGDEPNCQSSNTSYCVGTELLSGDWFCIDDEGNNERVTTGDPCDDDNSTCR